jgi:hypothetical protein
VGDYTKDAERRQRDLRLALLAVLGILLGIAQLEICWASGEVRGEYEEWAGLQEGPLQDGDGEPIKVSTEAEAGAGVVQGGCERSEAKRREC